MFKFLFTIIIIALLNTHWQLICCVLKERRRNCRKVVTYNFLSLRNFAVYHLFYRKHRVLPSFCCIDMRLFTSTFSSFALIILSLNSCTIISFRIIFREVEVHAVSGWWMSAFHLIVIQKYGKHFGWKRETKSTITTKVQWLKED